VVAVNDALTFGGVGHGFEGAIALAYYVGDPRATRDIDVNVAVPVDRAEAVLRLLPASVSWGGDDVRRCMADGQVRLWCGPAGDGIPVDLFFPQHAFHQAVAEATTVRPFGRLDYLLPVISATHLAVFKALFDRPRDWVDIDAMLQAGTVDVVEAMGWLRHLLGADHATCGRFAELAVRPGVPSAGPGADMHHPPVDWRSLGHPAPPGRAGGRSR
jgi:hypothetical protein